MIKHKPSNLAFNDPETIWSKGRRFPADDDLLTCNGWLCDRSYDLETDDYDFFLSLKHPWICGKRYQTYNNSGPTYFNKFIFEVEIISRIIIEELNL